MKHLLSIEDLDADDLRALLELTDHMVEVSRRPIPKVPALRGKTVATLFFEDSTRTRTSFDTAARRLSADTMSLSVASSSVNKGESLRDTVETICAMGVDALVIRHRSSGAAQQVTRWTSASVINAGDGWHQHPTQALLDCYTIRQHLGGAGSFDGLEIAIVGDIKHSRVARSDVQAFSALGAQVTLVAPRTLLPAYFDDWPVRVADSIDDVIATTDVLYLLRVQRERMAAGLLPAMREYSTRFGLDAARARRLRADAIVMHPGPMNRDIEMLVDPAELPGSAILTQVASGVSVRMAVLFQLLGAETKGTP